MFMVLQPHGHRPIYIVHMRTICN